MDPLGILKRAIDRLRGVRIEPIEPPLTFVDGAGREVIIRPYERGDFEGVVAMYDDFDSRQRAQGTPPIGVEAIEAWLEEILSEVNAVALVTGAVVGHVCFVPRWGWPARARHLRPPGLPTSGDRHPIARGGTGPREDERRRIRLAERRGKET